MEATGTATLRRRRLPAEQVIWLVLGMALLRDRPIAEVVSKLDLALPGKDGSPVVAPSSVAQARQMERIAAQAKVPPSRISFVAAMRFIRDEWAWSAVASPGSIPNKLQRMRDRVATFVLPPRRRERSYPRAVKVKMSNYPTKRTKRPGRAAK